MLRMYVCMSRMYACMYVCMHAYMHAYMHTCMHACRYAAHITRVVEGALAPRHYNLYRVRYTPKDAGAWVDYSAVASVGEEGEYTAADAHRRPLILDSQ